MLKKVISPEDYNFDYQSPDNDALPNSIFPSSVGGNEADVYPKIYGGTEVKYGTNKTIYAARLSSEQEAVIFLKQNLFNEFEALPSHYCQNQKGQFSVKANGRKKRLIGWVNNRYVFVLKANNRKNMQQLIKSFKYISKSS